LYHNIICLSQVALLNPAKVGNVGYKSSGSLSFDQVDLIYDTKGITLPTFPVAPAYKFTLSAFKIKKSGVNAPGRNDTDTRSNKFNLHH
jgi:hypothetical protein